MIPDRLSILLMEAGSSGQGGSFISLLQLISLLTKDGHDVHVVLWNDSPLLAQYRACGAKIIQIPKGLYSCYQDKYRTLYNTVIAFFLRTVPVLLPYMEFLFQWKVYRQLKHYVRRHNINVIHLNNQPIRNFIGFWIAKKLKLPIISHLRTLHGYGFTRSHLKFIEKTRCQMIAVSDSAAKYWRSKGVPQPWITVLPNPYHGEFGAPVWTGELRRKLVYIGRLEESKGLLMLIHAFAKLIVWNSDITLTIIGDGALQTKLQKRCEELNIAEQVVFLGYRPDAKALLPEYDVLVFPSQEEGFGRVLVEAMAFGVPVVATRVPGVIDIVRHEQNGLLVEYGDSEQLKDAILRLFQDELLRNRLIQQGLQFAREKFNLENFYQKLIIVYETAWRMG